MQEGPYTWDENGNRVPLTVQEAERINRTPEGAGKSNQPEQILQSRHSRRTWKALLRYYSPGKPTDGFWLGDMWRDHGCGLSMALVALVLIVIMVVRLVQSFF